MRTFLLTLIILLNGFWMKAQEVSLELFAEGFNSVVEMAHAGDSRLFVVEKTGKIKILQPDGSTNSVPFLDVSNLISNGGEQGLLGLAFPSDYQTSGRFYINFTNTAGNTVIARYSVSSNPDIANTTGEPLLTIPQPFTNHNGGTLKFGPDHYLWISSGDGGGGGDPNGNGQNTNTLLGKILRIDVSGATYTSPSDNPFVGQNGAEEIWAYGARNPWKFSFDRETGDFWMADVGQNAIEEINQSLSTDGGLNYGWRCYEGNDPYNTAGCGAPESMTFPVAVYNHSSGRCSITGGYVYRGALYSNLEGCYFFGDFCSGEIGWVQPNGEMTFLLDSGISITSFGEDAKGELYVLGNGKVYKIKGEEMGVVEQNEWKVSFYPNPVSDILTIQSKQSFDLIHIYSRDGRLLKEQKGNTKQIGVSDLPAGAYIVVLRFGKRTKTLKFLKK